MTIAVRREIGSDPRPEGSAASTSRPARMRAIDTTAGPANPGQRSIVTLIRSDYAPGVEVRCGA